MRDLQQVYDMYVHAGTDILSEFIRSAEGGAPLLATQEKTLGHMNELLEYTNDQLRKLCNRYSKGVKQLQPFVRGF